MTDKNKTNIDLAKELLSEHSMDISQINHAIGGLEEEGQNGWAIKLTAHKTLVENLNYLKDLVNNLDKLKILIGDLRKYNEFEYSRKILLKLRNLINGNTDIKNEIYIIQQLSLSTYKNPDITINRRFDDAENILIRAFDILEEDDKKNKTDKELSTSDYQETYGIAGAINKYRWESDGRKENLERSLNFYKKGYKLGPKTDYGYTGINYAYVLDYLAYLEFNELTDKNNLTDSIKTKLEGALDVTRSSI